MPPHERGCAPGAACARVCFKRERERGRASLPALLGEGARMHALVSPRGPCMGVCMCAWHIARCSQDGKSTRKHCSKSRPSACMCMHYVCVHMCSRTPCPLPLFLPCASLFFTPSLRSLPLSSLSRAPSPTTAFAPRPLALSSPSLPKTRKVPEDRLGQVVQLIIVQIKVPAGNTGEGGITNGRRCIC